MPGEARKRQYVINKLKGVFESFGFEPLETPALEYEEVLLGKYGEEGDKLMYRFTDNGGRKVALRYDQTVPLARVAAQYQNELPIPFKRYQIQPVWRAENTQKGRFREFLQCDIDTVGTTSPLADAEIIATVAQSLKELGFENFRILINDRNLLPSIKTLYLTAIDKLAKIGEEGVIRELEQKGLNTNEANEILKDIKALKASADLIQIKDIFGQFGYPKEILQFTPTLVRGLDYYTGMIFEVEVEGYTAGSVAGGGRFDKLVGMFASQSIPAVGIAYGFDRIVDAMTQLNLFPDDLATTKVLVTIFSKQLEQKSIEVSSHLRSNNINCELWLDPEAKLDKQLKYADQKGIPYVVIIGPNEAQENKLTLKDLKNKTQEVLSLDAAIRKLTS